MLGGREPGGAFLHPSLAKGLPFQTWERAHTQWPGTDK